MGRGPGTPVNREVRFMWNRLIEIRYRVILCKKERKRTTTVARWIAINSTEIKG